MSDIEGDAYGELVHDIIRALEVGRTRAMASVARERFRTYHAIGRAILDRQKQQGWGNQVVKRLAADLRVRFPDQTGLGNATCNTCAPSRVPGPTSIAQQLLRKSPGAT